MVELCSPKRYAEVLTPISVIRLRRGHTELGWGLIQYNWYTCKKRTDTGTKKNKKREGHVEMEAEIRMMLRTPGTMQTPQEAMRHSFLETSEGSWSCQHPNFEFHFPRTVKE